MRMHTKYDLCSYYYPPGHHMAQADALLISASPPSVTNCHTNLGVPSILPDSAYQQLPVTRTDSHFSCLLLFNLLSVFGKMTRPAHLS